MSILVWAVPVFAERSELIYAFRSFQDRPRKMILVGDIRSKTKDAKPEEKETPYSGYDTRMDQVMVKVHNRTGLKVGQTLYIIDKNSNHAKFRDGLIMGEITVSAIFHNPFYGWVVTGTGNLLRVREGLFVARTLETENLDRAYALKKKGDHYMSGGEMERAMAAYQQALEADGSLPEAHSALGILFLKEALEGGKEEPIRSLSEFNLAWKVRANFRHAYDEFVFYENFMRTLLVIHEMRSVKTTKEQSLLMLLDQSLEAGQQANRLKKESPVIHTMLLKTIRLKMGYFPGDSASSRKNRDALEDQAMKELLFLAGGPVSDSEYHAEAARLLYSLYRSSDDASPRRTGLMAELYVKPIYALSRSTLQKPSVTDQKERLQQCIHFHLTQYYRLHHGSADPYLEMIRRSIGG